MKLNSCISLKLLLSTIVITLVSFAPVTLFSANITINSGKKEKKVEYTVPISEFNSIAASSAIQVIYVQGSSTGKAKITTTPTGKKYLKVEVSHGTLQLRYSVPNSLKNVSINGPTIITVQSPNLKEVSLTSAATLEILGQLDQTSVSFKLTSASKATVKKVNCSNLIAELTSSSSLSVDNLLGDPKVNVTSAAKVSLGKIDCSDASFSATSAAKISVNKITGNKITSVATSGAHIDIEHIFCHQVSGSATSGARINFAGKCDILSQSSSSGGRVDSSNLSENQSDISVTTVTRSSGSSSTSTSRSATTTPSKKANKSKKKSNKSKKTTQQSGDEENSQTGRLRIP